MISDFTFPVLISILIAIFTLTITLYSTSRKKPIINHVIVKCIRKELKSSQSVLIELRVYFNNIGERGTRLLKIEAEAIDLKGQRQNVFRDLSQISYLDSHSTSEGMKITFVFPTNIDPLKPCKFKLYHTSGTYSFEFSPITPEENEQELRRMGIDIITSYTGEDFKEI